MMCDAPANAQAMSFPKVSRDRVFRKRGAKFEKLLCWQLVDGSHLGTRMLNSSLTCFSLASVIEGVVEADQQRDVV